MYCKTSLLVEARILFDLLPSKNVVTWNLMIGGYAQQGLALLALRTFESMDQQGLMPDDVNFLSALKAYGMLGVALEGRLIHGQCASMQLDEVTFSSVIKACTVSKLIKDGQLFHIKVVKLGLESNPIVNGALLDLYASDGLLEEAQKVLHCPSSLNLVSSNEMVVGYVKHGLACSTLTIFKDMQGDGLQLDIITYSSILKAWAVGHGLVLHDQIMRLRFESNPTVRTCLIDMYGKLGSLQEASNVFLGSQSYTLESWTAMIAGFHNKVSLSGLKDSWTPCSGKGGGQMKRPTGVFLLAVVMPQKSMRGNSTLGLWVKTTVYYLAYNISTA
ncbi:hypothetical protein L7F22_020736 [Adiantum nelumboides]|nr:hypothetical protein [Adiantum nelumboides]